MLSDKDIEQMKKPSLWGEHNRMLKNPHYRMEGLMDCLREELMMNMPLSTEEAPIVNIESEPWTKKQWGEVQQLKAQVLHLSNKINEMRANASKQRKDTI